MKSQVLFYTVWYNISGEATNWEWDGNHEVGRILPFSWIRDLNTLGSLVGREIFPDKRKAQTDGGAGAIPIDLSPVRYDYKWHLIPWPFLIDFCIVAAVMIDIGLDQASTHPRPITNHALTLCHVAWRGLMSFLFNSGFWGRANPPWVKFRVWGWGMGGYVPRILGDPLKSGTPLVSNSFVLLSIWGTCDETVLRRWAWQGAHQGEGRHLETATDRWYHVKLTFVDTGLSSANTFGRASWMTNCEVVYCPTGNLESGNFHCILKFLNLEFQSRMSGLYMRPALGVVHSLFLTESQSEIGQVVMRFSHSLLLTRLVYIGSVSTSYFVCLARQPVAVPSDWLALIGVVQPNLWARMIWVYRVRKAGEKHGSWLTNIYASVLVGVCS